MPPLLRLVLVLSLIVLGTVLVRNITLTLEGRPVYRQDIGFRFNPGYEPAPDQTTASVSSKAYPSEEPLRHRPVDVRHVADDVAGQSAAAIEPSKTDVR